VLAAAGALGSGIIAFEAFTPAPEQKRGASVRRTPKASGAAEMDEDRVVHLLEEIRDLQRQQVEAYARALRNQEEALERQRQAMRKARGMFAVVGVVILVLLVVVLVLLRYVLQHYA
jgi:CHASE3 domain sensor protein